MNYLLSIITFLPLLGAAVILVTDKDEGKKYVALATTLLTFVVSLALIFGWQEGEAGMQFVEDFAWLPEAGFRYQMGVDGISLFLVLLTTFLMPIAIGFSNQHVTEHVGPYLALMLMLQTAMTGVFLALDLVLFFIFFEASLIPMYFLIGQWGGDNRRYASMKFMLYTLVGSGFMLVAFLGIYFSANTTDIVALQSIALPENLQLWAFLALGVALAVKVPLFPLHTWLPDAHVQAPTAGSIILAGVLLKMGTYGYVRLALPILPLGAERFGPIFAGLAIIGIIYGALVALVQKDIKSLVAYSSVAHLGFVVLGIFAFNMQGVSGAVLQMINHGLSTGALFLMVGMLYERRHTRMLDEFGGLWRSVPLFCGFFLVVILSSAGLPGLNGFVGEFTILIGTYAYNPWFAFFAALGVILAAWYLLTAFRSIAQGPLTNSANNAGNLADLTSGEMIMLVPLVLLFFIIGLFPNLFLDKINPSVAAIFEPKSAIVLNVDALDFAPEAATTHAIKAER